MSVDIAVVAIHTQSGKEHWYWHEHQHCSCTNATFQISSSMGIMNKHNWVVQHSGRRKTKNLVKNKNNDKILKKNEKKE